MEKSRCEARLFCFWGVQHTKNNEKNKKDNGFCTIVFRKSLPLHN
jgi:hypothetical protein